MNLGYGRITDGWSQGPANVATPFDLFPTDLNWSDVLTALVNGVPQGIEAAIADLANPDNYQIPSLLDNPTLTPLVDAAFTSGLIDTLQPTSLQLTQVLLGGSFPVPDATLLSPWADLVNDFTSTLSADYASLLPIEDTPQCARNLAARSTRRCSWTNWRPATYWPRSAIRPRA